MANRTTARDEPQRHVWGAFPALCLVGVLGLISVGLGNVGAAAGAAWADLAFFGGLLILFVPVGLRLLMEQPSKQERMALVVALALGLLVCKVFRDPIWPSGYDEYLHIRTAADIVRFGGLFAPNSLLGVSPYYPGLELTTAAVSQMLGISLFDAGLVTLAASRIVFLLALYLFFDLISGSARVAGVACLIYMTNPHFLYFNSSFAYESLALPLAVLALYLLARRGHSVRAHWAGLTAFLLLIVPSVVTTHHVTSFAFAALLGVWGVVAVIIGKGDVASAKPGRIGVLTIAVIAAWTLIVATATIGYLGPVLSSTVSELLRLIGGDLNSRELFVSRSGEVAPVWERLTGSLAAGVLIFVIPLGLIVVWRRYRSNAAVVTMALVATLYPASLLARLTAVGSEVASRTPEFLFVGIGFVVALALVRLSLRGRFRVVHIAVATVLIALLSFGGVLIGLPTWARLPGPYLVSADGRSVEAEGVAAAEWAERILGPGNEMVADRVNRILMSAYGLQDIVTTYESGVAVRRLYLTYEIGPVHRDVVRDGHVKYLVADWRLTTGVPVVGHYFDRGEEAIIGRRDVPLDPVLLSKFDRLLGVNRVFDSGNIRIYDVSGLASAN